MDRYQTALRSEITAYGEQLAKLREEIASLTVRREALEHALAVYEETKPARAERGGRLGRAGSKTAFVLDAIRKSGARGLATDDIYGKIAAAGLTIQQTTIRSLLYQRKKAGLLEHLSNGRYRFLQPGANGADTEKADDGFADPAPSPALSEHRTDHPVEPRAQGREAVPWGGT